MYVDYSLGLELGSRLKSPGNLKDNYNNHTLTQYGQGPTDELSVGLLYVHGTGGIKTSQNIQYCER
jgi:hypothetical protein